GIARLFTGYQLSALSHQRRPALVVSEDPPRIAHAELPVETTPLTVGPAGSTSSLRASPSIGSVTSRALRASSSRWPSSSAEAFDLSRACHTTLRSNLRSGRKKVSVCPGRALEVQSRADHQRPRPAPARSIPLEDARLGLVDGVDALGFQ